MEVTGESGMSNPITDGNRLPIRIDQKKGGYS